MRKRADAPEPTAAEKIQQLQQQIATQASDEVAKQQSSAKQKTQAASQYITLNEELTRILIDQQLRDAGWEADTQELTYQKGCRPEKGKNKAISEWPTKLNGESGRADYALFCGLTPIAVVEAKKENVNVAGKIDQAERYSRAFNVVSPLTGAWELAGLTVAWPDSNDGHYKVPFVYSCNGKKKIPQLLEKSGTWFRDVRDLSNIKVALDGFHTPTGLLDLLKRSKAQAEQQLKQEPFGYLNVRKYQKKAIEAVETALAENRRTALLAMATGTGNTRTIIGLLYRFLKAERFKRMLFLAYKNIFC